MAAQQAQSLPADVPPPPPQHAPRWEHDQWRQRHQERLTRHQQEVSSTCPPSDSPVRCWSSCTPQLAEMTSALTTADHSSATRSA